MQKILVIDDDKDLCLLLHQFLSRKGYFVTTIYSGVAALDYLENEEPDLIICDLKLEDIDGITLLSKVKEKYNDLPVIIITAYSDITTSALAIKQGAYDYVMKPLLTEQILLLIQEAVTHHKMEQTKSQNVYGFDDQKGDDFVWIPTKTSEKLLKQVQLVAPTGYNIIIYGEDGVGKKTLAYEIHKRSLRSEKPFMVLKSGSLNKEILEEHLFGSEIQVPGVAINNNVGLLEQSNGGTFFISEIEALPLNVQEKLLKFLQKRKMRRQGSNIDIDLDVRIIVSATNILWNATRKGNFNEDLYHRLNGFNITLLPLRLRKQDIPAFANHLLQVNNNLFNKTIKGFSSEALSTMTNYKWLDNIRELKNIIKKAVLLCNTDYIGIECLPVEILIKDENGIGKNQEYQ